jgi:hypothetical protein
MRSMSAARGGRVRKVGCKLTLRADYGRTVGGEGSVGATSSSSKAN